MQTKTSKNSSEHETSRRQFLKAAGVGAATLGMSGLLSAQAAASTVTLAIAGCAHIHTPGFVNLLKQRADVKVKSIWDHQRARAEKHARTLGSHVVDDVRTIWDDPQIQGVVICSETNRHLELVLAAAAARKHMFVEKPLGITAQESNQMAGAIEKAGLLFTTGYFMRTFPQHIFLKEQIAAGAFGKITRARGSNCHNGSIGRWFDTDWRWMADPKIAGVGAFGDLGTHSLDILMWLLGDVESITAHIKVVLGNYGDCDESGEALMQFKNGVTATLAAGWVDVEDPVTLLISGTEGHAVIIKGRLYFKCAKVEGANGQEPWTRLPSAPPAPLNQFVEAVAGRKDMPLVTPHEAAARVSVMEAAYKAAKNRSWEKPA